MYYVCSFICVLYSVGSGVKNVHVALSAFRMRLFLCVHAYMSYKYDLIFLL